ncbi:MAG TPA: tetratricopeptide repeat protein [Gammaproteobacteria bacterium]
MNRRFPITLASLLCLAFILSACTHEEPEVSGDPEMRGEAAKAGNAGLKGETADEHVKRGDEYLEQGNIEEAVKAFDAAIALNPGADEAYVKKGIALIRLSKFEEAIAQIDKALQVSGRDKTWQWSPLYHKGVAQAMSGDLKAALESFTKSIESNPNYQNYHGRAKTYADLGEPHKALADVRAGLQHKPDDQMLNMFLSHLESRINTQQEPGAKEMAAKDGAQKQTAD